MPFGTGSQPQAVSDSSTPQNVAPTGSAGWWNENADKLIGIGQTVLTTIGLIPQPQTATTTKPYQSISVSNFEEMLPYILGGIAVIGIMPYISLQLKAVSSGIEMLRQYPAIVMPPAMAASVAK